MPLIYIKVRAIFQPNGSRIDFFLLKWDHYFIFGFLCLIKPDFDRISTLELFISQKMGYFTVYVSHLGFLSPASIWDPHEWIPIVSFTAVL